MGRSQRVRLTLGVLAVLAMLDGCSTPLTEESSGGRIIAVSGQVTDAQAEALAKGTVEWGEGGCMVIAVDRTHLIVFPRGTTIDDNDKVTLPNGYRISAGDEVALGGGYRSVDTTKEDLSAIPEECLTEEIFWASGEVTE